MVDIVQWLKDGWVIIGAIIAGITLMWNFISKTLKEISKTLYKPIDDINTKVDDINEKLTSVRKDDSLVKNAILNLQRRSLLDSCENYIRRGYATLEEKETISKQFVSYEELGGNSFVGKLVDSVNKLPFESRKKSKKSAD